MARFYGKERSKVGSTSGTIIVWPIELTDSNPNSDVNKQKLPAGYLKCDGKKYNASLYPELAAICGTGTNCKFVRKNINGVALTTLTDEEFVVPDLGSKYPRPVPGIDDGTYNAINVTTKAGVEKRRSGIGIDATSTVGNITKVTYTGKFVIPAQTIKISGKPSWTKGTSNLGYTDKELVDNSSIFPHMHFSNTNRCRIKSTNVDATGLDKASGACYYKNASTINIETWLSNTKVISADTFTFRNVAYSTKGTKQPPCWAIATNNATKNMRNPSITFSNQYVYFNICQKLLTTNFGYSCLLNQPTRYFPSDQPYALGNPSTVAKYNSSLKIGFLCGIKDQTDRTWEPELNAGSDPHTPISIPIVSTNLYTQGAVGVPDDWLGNSLYDVVPLNVNENSTATLSYPQVSNVATEITEPLQQGDDPTLHNHKIQLEDLTHTYKVKTRAFLLDPDALNTQLTISTDTAASMDSVSAPYIILEYLIKI